MDNKILAQDLANGLVARSGLSKKDSDTFVRSFFDLIEENLSTEKNIKVKGLGTFKVVEVSGRDSVNVNTGERIHIKGHSKINYTPDSGLRDFVNRPFADFESVVLCDAADIDFMESIPDVSVTNSEEIEQLPETEVVPEPTVEEIPASTPIEEEVAEPAATAEPELVSEEEVAEPAVAEEPEPVSEEEIAEPAVVEEQEYVPEEEVAEPAVVEEQESVPEEEVTESVVEEEPEAVEEDIEEESEDEEVSDDSVEDEDSDQPAQTISPVQTTPHTPVWSYLLYTLLFAAIAAAASYGGYLYGTGMHTTDNTQISQDESHTGSGSQSGSSQTSNASSPKAKSTAGSSESKPVKPVITKPNKPTESKVDNPVEIDYTEVVPSSKVKAPAESSVHPSDGSTPAMDQYYPQFPYGAYDIVGIEKLITVVQGDDIESLAKTHLKSRGNWVYIKALNELQDKSLTVGQKLKIPTLKLKKGLGGNK